MSEVRPKIFRLERATVRKACEVLYIKGKFNLTVPGASPKPLGNVERKARVVLSIIICHDFVQKGIPSPLQRTLEVEICRFCSLLNAIRDSRPKKPGFVLQSLSPTNYNLLGIFPSFLSDLIRIVTFHKHLKNWISSPSSVNSSSITVDLPSWSKWRVGIKNSKIAEKSSSQAVAHDKSARIL